MQSNSGGPAFFAVTRLAAAFASNAVPADIRSVTTFAGLAAASRRVYVEAKHRIRFYGSRQLGGRVRSGVVFTYLIFFDDVRRLAQKTEHHPVVGENNGE